MSELDAGTQLDVLIVVRIFGLTVVADPVNYRGVQIGQAGHLGADVPFVSTDIAAAWPVVEAMLARGYDVVLTKSAQHEALWACSFIPPAGISVAHTGAATAETAPLAICRAAVETAQMSVNPT